MDELLQQLVSNAQGFGAYAIIFGILVACGLGVPLPEDVSLILGGFLAYTGSVRLAPMAAVGFFGILAGDTLIFLAGRRLGAGALHGPLARVVTPEKRARVEQLFRRHGEKIIMIARFLPGVRAVTYFTAGSAQMRYWRFIAFDGLAALASAPLFVYLGYRLGDRLEWLLGQLRNGQLVVLGVGLFAAVIAFFVWRRRRSAVPVVPATPDRPAGVEDRPTRTASEAP